MLITFKSNASNNVVMLETDGKNILRLLGKDPDNTKGVFTLEQLPGAISAIKAAIKTDKAIDREPVEDNNYAEDGETVHLYQRASPVLEILERSLKENEVVTWGL